MTDKEYLEKWWLEYSNGLSRSAITELWNRAQKSEREACAVTCEQQLGFIAECPEMAAYCADAIRMRSNAKLSTSPTEASSKKGT